MGGPCYVPGLSLLSGCCWSLTQGFLFALGAIHAVFILFTGGSGGSGHLATQLDCSYFKIGLERGVLQGADTCMLHC